MGAGDIFDVQVSATDVERAVEATIRRWLTTYLAEIERHTGRDPRALPVFRAYVQSVDTDRMSEDQLPACVVVCPGLIDRPQRRGDGFQDAGWAVGLAAVVSAKDRDSTIALAKDYIAALRMLVLQQRSMGGFAEEMEWIDERYDELDTADSRTLVAGIIQFSLHVPKVVNVAAGPVVPPDDPYAPPVAWTTVQAPSVSTGASA